MCNVCKKILMKFAPFRFFSWLLGKYSLEQSIYGSSYSAEMFKYWGKDVRIDPEVIITDPSRAILHSDVCIHRGSILNTMGGLIVGKIQVSGIFAQSLRAIITIEWRLLSPLIIS